MNRSVKGISLVSSFLAVEDVSRRTNGPLEIGMMR